MYFVYMLMHYTHHNSTPTGRHAADDIFKFAFKNEKFCAFTRISLEFVPQGALDNKLSLLQVMARRRVGDKPLHEAMFTHWRIHGALGGWVLNWMNSRRYALVCIASNLDTFEQINFSLTVPRRRTFLEKYCTMTADVLHGTTLDYCRILGLILGVPEDLPISHHQFMMTCTILINIIETKFW